MDSLSDDGDSDWEYEEQRSLPQRLEDFHNNEILVFIT